MKTSTVIAALVTALMAAAGALGGEAQGRAEPARRSPLPYARVKVAIPTGGGLAEVREHTGAPAEAAPTVLDLSPAAPSNASPASRKSPSIDSSADDISAMQPPDMSAAGEPAAPAGPSADSRPEAETEARAKQEPRVLAIMAGKPITDEDILHELWKRRGRETLEWLVGKSILENELHRLGLSVTEAEADDHLEKHLGNLEKAFPHLADADDLVRAASGMKLDEYRERTVWVELALRKIMRADHPATDQQLRSYFAERQEAYIQPERVRITQLFIPPVPGAAEQPPDHADWALAERNAQEAHARLRNGDNFRLAAATLGSGATTSRWVERGELLRELEDTVFTLSPGAMSAPLRSSLGYHIIRIDERSERKLPAFEEVRDQVRAEYEEKLFVYQAGEFMTRLRQRAFQSGSLVVADLPLLFLDSEPAERQQQ